MRSPAPPVALQSTSSPTCVPIGTRPSSVIRVDGPWARSRISRSPCCTAAGRPSLPRAGDRRAQRRRRRTGRHRRHRLQAAGCGAGRPDAVARPRTRSAPGPSGPVIPAPTEPPTVRDVVQRALAASGAPAAAPGPIVRLDADDEGVHQMRLDPAAAGRSAHVRARARRLGSRPDRGRAALAGRHARGVRDLDVLAAKLEAASVQMPDGVATAARRSSRGCAPDARRRQTLVHALSSDRYLSLVNRLVELALAPPVIDLDGERSIEDVLIDLVLAPWCKLRERDALEDDTSDDALHEAHQGQADAVRRRGGRRLRPLPEKLARSGSPRCRMCSAITRTPSSPRPGCGRPR